jgi:hypothetical protein
LGDWRRTRSSERTSGAERQRAASPKREADPWAFFDRNRDVKSAFNQGDGFMRRFLLAAVAVVALTAPAFANHCPKDMAAIDAALAKNPKLSAEQLDQVKKLRAQGEAQHKAGDHTGSVQSLQKAEDILGIPHVM